MMKLALICLIPCLTAPFTLAQQSEASVQRVSISSYVVGSGKQVVSRVPVDMLSQLSGSLQQLASKVSPAVVQIEVSGFGPAEDSTRRDTALVVRQHAIGSGVIVDPDGYIITNAHVWKARSESA